jgi:hypothetical protein
MNQPATIPDVAAGVGHGYRWAQASLRDLREARLVLRWPSNPARFALTDDGAELVEHMNAMVGDAITSAHGWPATVIAGRVLALLSGTPDFWDPAGVATGTAHLSNAVVAARCLGVEPQVVQAWVNSNTLRPPPWTEEDLRGMAKLPGSVAAVWPELLQGARTGHRFADTTKRLGITTQKVASAITRDPALRLELDAALMAGRDPEVEHGRRLAYRRGCWCPECRRAQLGR